MVSRYYYASNKALSETQNHYGTTEDGLRANAFHHAPLENMKIMKLFGKAAILLSSLLVGCDIAAITGGYHDLGRFSSRIAAQNHAIATIFKKYGSLPNKGYYKVTYANANSLPTEHRENALWYNKSDSTLALEVDVNSGTVCNWQQVSRAVLERATKSVDGLSKIDSLAKPNQPFSQCFR
ncbi:hypothetical protein [Spirosoma areae]